jgi:sigma-B regulation protein RsbU (phosphoserine phosphatase)
MSPHTGGQRRRSSGFGRPPTVALLLDRIREGYQWSLLRGAIDGALDGSAHLLCFAGGILGAERGLGGERNSVFELAGPSSVDAVVVASGAIGNQIDAARLEAYCQRFRPLPMCSIAVELAGMSSVCIDNESGSRALIEHLCRVHGMKRVAFIRGPAANPEAERRFAAYAAALATEGIPLEPELVVSGDFEERSGREAVEVLLGQRKLSPHALDAIVAANDAMAMGAIAELTERGIRVPDQIAVVGFDDVDESSLTLPPLTSVRQPLYEQGRDAVRLVLEQLRRGAAPGHLIRRTELVVRQSCRCLGQREDAEAPGRSTEGTRLGFEAAFVGRRVLILAGVARAARGRLSGAGADWGERLVNAFAEQLRGTKDRAFVRVYDDLLRRLSATGADLTACNDVLSALRAATLRCFDADPTRRGQAENMLHDVRVMTADAMRRAEAWRRIRAESRAAALGHAAAAIASAHDREDLARAVAAHLPGLGIARCYLAEYGDDGVGVGRGSRLVIDQRPDARSHDHPAAALRPIAEILRHDVLPTTGEHAFAVLPIAREGVDVGVLVVELSAPAAYLYEVLHDVFTAALQTRA